MDLAFADRGASLRLGFAPSFWREVAANHARYPLGVDLLLVAGRDVMALPRSTAILDCREPLMYVAVKGGEAAILATHDLLAERRRGDPAVPEISVDADPRADGPGRRPRHERGLAL